MPHFSILFFFEMPHFSLLILKTENEPKMNIFDFGAFRKKMHIPSHDKFLFHILFGAFHVTPRSMVRHRQPFEERNETESFHLQYLRDQPSIV